MSQAGAIQRINTFSGFCNCVDVMTHNTNSCDGTTQYEKWLAELSKIPTMHRDSDPLRAQLIIAILLDRFSGLRSHYRDWRDHSLSLDYPQLCHVLATQAEFLDYMHEFDQKERKRKTTAELFTEAHLIVEIGHKLLQDDVYMLWFSTQHTLETRMTIMREQRRICGTLEKIDRPRSHWSPPEGTYREDKKWIPVTEEELRTQEGKEKPPKLTPIQGLEKWAREAPVLTKEHIAMFEKVLGNNWKERVGRQE